MRQGGKQCENYHLLALLLILAVGALPALAITWGQRDTDNKYPNVGAFMVYDIRYDELNQGKHKAKFTVVGSGATLYWPPPDIDYEDKRQFAVSEYRALLKAWLRMSQNYATDDGGPCYGDSGGPAFRTEPDGTEILVGITSWGDMPCVATGCNYRVDIPETLDFLDGVINSLK